MFKNLCVYRISPQWSCSLDQIEAKLQERHFVPCSASQPRSAGWIAPRNIDNAPLVESIGGHWLLRLMVEQKVLPGSVVKRRMQEMAQQIEKASGRKPGKKQMKEIKEDATLELLPMAFTKQAGVNVWIDPKNQLLTLDCSSQAKPDEVLTCLVEAMPDFAVNQLNTNTSPAVCMSEWLLTAEPPQNFSIDRECELKSSDDMKSVVKYARHHLDIDEVRQHISSGKQPTKLAMTWNDRVSFMLTDTLCVKRLSFQDVVFEAQSKEKDDEFDADAAIATGELSNFLPDLIAALGGEMEFAGG